jgi:YbgC/YbaW family acyl-CoA thioester hydrolase
VSFIYRRRVQFADTDMAGMVHFTWYFRYIEEAEHALWRAAGLTIASNGDDLRFPRVSASCDFRAPLRFEDEADVEIHVDAIGSRTIRYAASVKRGDAVVATGSMTVACIRTAPGAPAGAVDIPREVARALEKFARV